MLTEHQRLCSLLGPGELCENDAGHHGLDNDAKAGLDHHDDDSLGTVRCGGASSVPDGVLRLYGEEQRRVEVVHLLHTNINMFTMQAITSAAFRVHSRSL